MKLLPRPTYANVVATLALFIALGGAAYAATQLPRNSVGVKQLKKNAVTTPKIKNGAVTGAKIALSTLGKVPEAAHADAAVNADRLGGAPPSNYAGSKLEAIHLVGTPGEPPFDPGVSNSSLVSTTHAGFYKDSFGLVHLQGTVNAPTGHLLFTLPPGFRPQSLVCWATPAFVGLTYKVNRGCVSEDGSVYNDRGEGTEYISLDGFTFRPG
jgi:hypothetical protein